MRLKSFILIELDISSRRYYQARGQDSFKDRMGAAVRIKVEGNLAFRDGGFGDALSKYEMALSVFRYIENTNPKWKEMGIKDEHLEEQATNVRQRKSSMNSTNS